MLQRWFVFASVLWLCALLQTAALANDPHCEGSPGWYSTSCPDPSADEVVVYADGNAGGKCMRFSPDFSDLVNEPFATPGTIPSLSKYGFNDCISSVKVGSNVRLLAFKDDWFNSIPSGTGLPIGRNHNLTWQLATYDPDAPFFWPAFSWLLPWAAEATVNDDFSSLIVERISQTNGERIPTHYVGSDPSGDGTAFWSQEPQGLCHDKTHWFIAEEVDVYGQVSTCVQNGGLTGRIWKVPRDLSLSVPRDIGRALPVPDGRTFRDLNSYPAPFGTLGNYRHFGDPDCQNIAGKDYVFIPVQSCTPPAPDVEPLPYVLVLDSDLNFVAGLTIPTEQPSGVDLTSLQSCLGLSSYAQVIGSDHGMGSWVAIRPSPAAALEVWMSTDVCDGQGLQVFNADLTKAPSASGGIEMTFKLWPPVIHDLEGLPEDFTAIQGGAFSPSGGTLYLSTGNTGVIGGVRVIAPDTGQEIAQSGNNYGPFNYQQEQSQDIWFPTGQEPEGLDFLDSRCSGTTVASTGASGVASQLHVVMNHNGLSDSGDQVELKHYAFGNNQILPMCEQTLFDATSDPGISSRGNGTLDVFDIAGGLVFQRSLNGSWDESWTPLPALDAPRHFVGKPASVSWDDTRIDLFVHDDLGGLHHLWSNYGQWAPSWEPIDAPAQSCDVAPFCKNLSVSSWGVNRLDVFDTVPSWTGDQTIAQITYDNGWQAPAFNFGDSPAGTDAIGAVSWGSSRIDLVGTSLVDGWPHSFQYFSNDGVDFYGPWDIGLAGIFFGWSNIAISSWGYSDLEILTVQPPFLTPATVIGQRSFRPDTFWSDWGTSGLAAGGGAIWTHPIASTSSGPGRIDVVFASSTYTTATTVSHAWFVLSDGVWSGPEQL